MPVVRTIGSVISSSRGVSVSIMEQSRCILFFDFPNAFRSQIEMVALGENASILILPFGGLSFSFVSVFSRTRFTSASDPAGPINL